MLKYRLINVEKNGKNNVYTIEYLNKGSYIQVNSKDIKQLLEDNEIVNARWKSKIVETPDVLVYMKELMNLLMIGYKQNARVYALERRDKSADGWVYYKFFNENGLDITSQIWGSCKGDWNLKQNGFISVREDGRNMSDVVVERVNTYAVALGILPIITYVEVIKKMPKKRSNNY